MLLKLLRIRKPAEVGDRTGSNQPSDCLELPDMFMGERNDGLGERLRAIVNAQILAASFGKPFHFAWPIRVDMCESHVIRPANEIFASEFLAQLLTNVEILDRRPHLFGDLVRLRFSNREVTAIASQYDTLPEHIIEKAEACFRIGTGSVFNRAFRQITFTPALQNALAAAEEAIPSGFSALHLRAGDIIYGRFRFDFNRFMRKALPFTLAMELIERESACGRAVVIFGQDAALCQALAVRYGQIFAGDLAEERGFKNTQAALFEIGLMSRAEKIIAGNSGFAQLSAMIRGIASLDPWLEFSPDEIARISARTMTDPLAATLHPLQRAYARWYNVYKNWDVKSPRWAADQLQAALAEDPENGLYQFFQALALKRAGDSAAAEAVLEQALRADVVSFVGDYRIGGIMHALTNLPAPDRLLAEQYLPELAEGLDDNCPFTAFALGLSLSTKKARRQDGLSYIARFRKAGRKAPKVLRDFADGM